ncbi:MAG TPA: hypothetical protein VE890_13495 [Thermoguttaceae bacterium]|nr:hypothetical protein [Thermoguttaceae bacterium]
MPLTFSPLTLVVMRNCLTRLTGRIPLLLAFLAATGGCSSVIEKENKLLGEVHLPPDSIVLDVFFVRVPLGDPKLNDELWQQVDEQHFPATLRQRLGRNGFRVGLAGSPVPQMLSELLELDDAPVASGEANQVDIAQIEVEPRVQRRHMSLRAGKHGDIVTSSVYQRLAVPTYELGQLSVQTYAQAQTHLTVEATPQSDGRVQLNFTPELRHGQSRMTPRPVVGNEAIFQLASTQPCRKFDDLSISATVSPGAMLVVSCLPDRAGSLGHHFFTCDNDRLEQKLLVVRLSQTQHDDSIVADELLTLPE